MQNRYLQVFGALNSTWTEKFNSADLAEHIPISKITMMHVRMFAKLSSKLILQTELMIRFSLPPAHVPVTDPF